MNVSNRCRLALAVTALITPLAGAQAANTAVDATGQVAVPTTEQSIPEAPPPALPPPTVDPTPEGRPNQDAPLPAQLNESQPPPVDEAEEAAMTPPGKRGKVRAAGHAGGSPAAVAPRGWAQLDVNADGRISAQEARADGELSASFRRADSDRDGFISEAEFRARGNTRRQGERDDGN